MHIACYSTAGCRRAEMEIFKNENLKLGIDGVVEEARVRLNLCEERTSGKKSSFGEASSHD